MEDRLLWENVWQGGRGFLLLVISCALYAGLLFMTEGKARFLLPFLLFFPAMEDRRTGYISDGWSALLLLCGLLTSYEAGMIYGIAGRRCFLRAAPGVRRRRRRGRYIPLRCDCILAFAGGNARFPLGRIGIMRALFPASFDFRKEVA